MKRMAGILLVFLCGTLGAAVALAQDAALGLVKETSERMLEVLEARQIQIEREPQLLYGFVEEIVLPHFDFERITRSAVGRYWRQASPGQRRGLIEEFRQVLVRTYATALTSYSGQTIRYLPLKEGPGADRVTVPTQIRNPGGSQISVDYRLYQQDDRWKVYDVVIDNVSLASNYRSSFATVIRSAGIDGLIARLAQKNASGQG